MIPPGAVGSDETRLSAPSTPRIRRSNTQGEILALLLLDPNVDRWLADVARAVAAPASVVHKEVSRLVDAGVLIDSRQGRSRLDRFTAGEPIWRVHEVVFAILALESEPVDPGLPEAGASHFSEINRPR